MKKTILWGIEKDILEKISKESFSLREILKKLDLKDSMNNRNKLKEKLNSYYIDFSHIALGHGHNKGKKYPRLDKRDLKDILVENSDYSGSYLKQRLINEGVLKNQCYKCGMSPFWNNEILVLQLDHINGISNDQRIENLRILCPNCHSQTHTFCIGSNIKIKEIIRCEVCKKEISQYNASGKCRDCFEKSGLRFFNEKKKDKNIDFKTFERQVNELGMVKVSKIYNVSRSTVRRWYNDYSKEQND